MIKDNQKSFNRLHVIIDGGLLALSYVFSYYLRFYTPLKKLFAIGGYHTLAIYSEVLFFLIPGYLVIYSYCNLYDPKRSRSKRFELWNITKANVFGIAYFTMVTYLLGMKDISRGLTVFFFLSNIILDTAFRSVLGYCLRLARRKGFNLKHIVLVGYSRLQITFLMAYKNVNNKKKHKTEPIDLRQ
jgi:FlaA1/EpsC-like NDP-sugar epimerase